MCTKTKEENQGETRKQKEEMRTRKEQLIDYIEALTACINKLGDSIVAYENDFMFNVLKSIREEYKEEEKHLL